MQLLIHGCSFVLTRNHDTHTHSLALFISRSLSLNIRLPGSYLKRDENSILSQQMSIMWFQNLLKYHFIFQSFRKCFFFFKPYWGLFLQGVAVPSRMTLNLYEGESEIFGSISYIMLDDVFDYGIFGFIWWIYWMNDTKECWRNYQYHYKKLNLHDNY